MNDRKETRYTVVKCYHGDVDFVEATNKRRTAHRMVAYHEAGNRSHIARYAVIDRNGREIVPSTARSKREGGAAAHWYERNTCAARGVW